MCVAGALLIAGPVGAQIPTTMEVTAGWHVLTAGHGSATGLHGRLTHAFDPRAVLYVDAGLRRDFGFVGSSWAVAATHLPADRWRIHGGVGGGIGDMIPSRQAHLDVSRLIAGGIPVWLGANARHVRWPTGRAERGAGIGADVYVAPTWLVRPEVRLTWSDGADRPAHRYMLAVTRGREGHRFLTFRLDTGRESYQPLPDAELVDFPSTAVSAAVRLWLRPEMGMLTRLHYYRNPSYARTGIDVGAFRQF